MLRSSSRPIVGLALTWVPDPALRRRRDHGREDNDRHTANSGADCRRRGAARFCFCFLGSGRFNLPPLPVNRYEFYFIFIFYFFRRPPPCRWEERERGSAGAKRLAPLRLGLTGTRGRGNQRHKTGAGWSGG